MTTTPAASTTITSNNIDEEYALGMAEYEILCEQANAKTKKAHPDITENGYTAAENARRAELAAIIKRASAAETYDAAARNQAEAEMEEIRQAFKKREGPATRWLRITHARRMRPIFAAKKAEAQRLGAVERAAKRAAIQAAREQHFAERRALHEQLVKQQSS